MSELYSFLDGAFADIRSKMDKEYQRRLAEHEAQISTLLSAEDYTPDYGKIDLDKAFRHFHNTTCSSCLTSHVYPKPEPPKLNIQRHVAGEPHARNYSSAETLLSELLPKGAWIIHYIAECASTWHQDSNGYSTYYREQKTYTLRLIDNYGKQYAFPLNYMKNHDCNGLVSYISYNTATQAFVYRLPNSLIDLCKTYTHDPYSRPNDSTIHWNTKPGLQKEAAEYYKRFTAMKPLFTSGRFTEYAALQAEKTALEERLAASAESTAAAKVAATAASAEATAREAALQSQLTAMRTELATLREELKGTKSALAESTAAHSKQTVAIKSLAQRLEVPPASPSLLTAVLTKYEEQSAARQKATRELALATKHIEQLRTENQRYVDQVFAQRQEITGYKKQLLEQPAAAAPNIEELVARAVARMMQPAPAQHESPPCPVALSVTELPTENLTTE